MLKNTDTHSIDIICIFKVPLISIVAFLSANLKTLVRALSFMHG